MNAMNMRLKYLTAEVFDVRGNVREVEVSGDLLHDAENWDDLMEAIREQIGEPDERDGYQEAKERRLMEEINHELSAR